jgi:hypothetical protein
LEEEMKLQTIALSLIGLTFAITSINAQGRHPAYLRARSDLRRAQFLMRVEEEPKVTAYLRAADRDTEAAIHEIDRAAVIDGKDLDDHPRVDTGIDRRGRFHRIVDLLRSARADIAREEDNGTASNWRDTAYRHIDLSLDNMRIAAKIANLDRELGF